MDVSLMQPLDHWTFRSSSSTCSPLESTSQRPIEGGFSCMCRTQQDCIPSSFTNGGRAGSIKHFWNGFVCKKLLYASYKNGVMSFWRYNANGYKQHGIHFFPLKFERLWSTYKSFDPNNLWTITVRSLKSKIRSCSWIIVWIPNFLHSTEMW